MHVPLELKRRMLPQGPRPRRVLWGPGRGLVLELDFEYQLRFYLGLYEAEIAGWLRKFCASGRRAYDVGADIGYQALAIARLSRGDVVAFEPNPMAAEQARRNIALNTGRVGPVELLEHFVGRDEGPGRITLDAFVEQRARFPPDFLLIDVDGGEVDVLLGGENLLRHRRPDVIVETHAPGLERECSAILSRCGYRPTVVSQRRLFADFRPTEHNQWLVAPGRDEG